MAGPEKRLPGQSNAEYEHTSYERRGDPNAAFLGTQSVVGGADPTWVMRLWAAVLSWRDRRRARRRSTD
jgi:hypothetical protein